MRPSHVPDRVADRTRTTSFTGSRHRVGPGTARGATAVLAVCGLTLALSVTTAHALFVPLGSFGSSGSGAGQFNTPVGVATDDLGSPGGVYVADSGNARVQKFDADG